MAQAEHILAVGDLHGRYDLLCRVLDEVIPQMPQGTRLVFLGDYIDRGPASAEVVERLIELRRQRPETLFLMGNHERMLLDAVAGWQVLMYLANGGEATLASYGLEEDELDRLPAEHVAFFRSLELKYLSGDYVFVHAGLRPGVPLDEQDPHDLVWIREEFFLSGVDFGKTVVFGHTPFRRPLIKPGLIGIDTGAVYGNQLTCLKLPEEEFIALEAS